MLTITLAYLLIVTTSSAKTIGSSPEPSTPEAAVAGQLIGLLGTMATSYDGEAQSSGGIGSQLLPALLQRLSKADTLKTTILNAMGLKEDFMKPLARLIEEVNELNIGQSFDTETAQSSGNSGPATNERFLKLASAIFEEEFGFLDSVLTPSTIGSPAGVSDDFNVTASSVWMMVKSTWQRILAYVEEDNSLQQFMQLTPVKIIDRLLSLGDDVNLANFLAKKLEPDFARYLVSEIDPYLGPLRDLDSFYSFARGYGAGGILEYFRSERFSRTMGTLSRLVSAYVENKISGDVVDQYIELISFDSPELRNFYDSVLSRRSQNSTAGEASEKRRFKRNVLDYIASSFKYGDLESEDSLPDDPQSKAMQDFEVYGSGESSPGREALSRDGGYGGYGSYSGGGYSGGGYGGGYGVGYMSTLDPYVVLGALALGTLLGFLLFRLLNGTRNGRRDIGDGSLSLWLSDLPNGVLPWSSSAERTRRHAQDFNTTGGDEFNLPDSMRGDVWSTDPLVGDDLLDDEFEEDDIADHLNHLWRVFHDTNSTTCVRSHLCGVVANSSAEHLTGKDSSLALIMASVADLMGAARPGQLVDLVTNSLVEGSPYSCPSLATCHHHLL